MCRLSTIVRGTPSLLTRHKERSYISCSSVSVQQDVIEYEPSAVDGTLPDFRGFPEVTSDGLPPSFSKGLSVTGVVDPPGCLDFTSISGVSLP